MYCPPPPPPDVLIVGVDDVGHSDLDTVPTPNIDALRSVSHDFHRFYVSGPVCVPSRMGFLTGQPSRNFEIGKHFPSGSPLELPPGTPTLGTLAQAAGYQAAHVGKWHVTGSNEEFAPGQLGFDEWIGMIGHNPKKTFLVDGSGKVSNYKQWNRIDGPSVAASFEYLTTAQASTMRSWWASTPGPKFGHLAFCAPHSPYHKPPEALLPPGTIVEPNHRSRYEAMLMSCDTELGRLLEVVDLEETWVLFWSDNGTPDNAPAPGQDPTKLKRSMYDGGIRVPMFVHAPGQSNYRGHRRLVSGLDIFATLRDILCSPLPVPSTSSSFASSLGVAGAPGVLREWVHSEWFSPNGPPPHLEHNQAVVDRDGWKLIRMEAGGSVTETLYKLPDEENPASDPAKHAALAAIMDGI